MIEVRRVLQVVVVSMVAVLWAQEAIAVTSFASEDVALAAKGPSVAEAFAARTKLEEAFAAQDIEAVADLFAHDLVVNSPANRVSRREQILGFFRAGRMYYESADAVIEAFDGRENVVVIMGEETYKPRETAAHAGKTVHRRFTDIWRKESDGKWRLTVRQATITSLE